MAADFAAERRLTAAKATFLSVTPGTVSARRRIARENAILQSNQDIPARKSAKGDPRVGEFPGHRALRVGSSIPGFSMRFNYLWRFEASCPTAVERQKAKSPGVGTGNVEIHLTLNWSCRLDEVFGACCSANSEPAVHLSSNYPEFGSFNFELSGAHSKMATAGVETLDDFPALAVLGQ
ncbi:hypothetical protein PQR53_35565 [Paraburkholderia fungorum]|uniref:hypothetical protein n=1 Tax=Paraburkholderia fungorum TaxID=134537 RepID=UPI0038B8600C